jgi:hypothetical protein
MPVLLLAFGLAVAIALAAGHHRKPPPKLPPPQPVVDEAGTVELDHGMPPDVVHQVLTALAHEKTPVRLESLAHELEGRYPLSAVALRTRAAALQNHGATVPGTPAEHGAPPPPHVQAPEAPSTVHPPPSAANAPHPPAPPTHAAPAHSAPHQELHAAAILQAAMRALVEEPDPVVLDGFAESIQEPYPVAASLLAQRAHALRAAAHAPPPAAAPVAPGTPGAPPQPPQENRT